MNAFAVVQSGVALAVELDVLLCFELAGKDDFAAVDGECWVFHGQPALNQRLDRADQTFDLGTGGD